MLTVFRPITIVAQTWKGKEFCFDPYTAHKVPKGRAQAFADALNNGRFNRDNRCDLPSDRLWFVYEITECDTKAWAWAEVQSFKARGGRLYEVKD